MNNQLSQEKVLKTFYLAGCIIFLIVGLANAYTNYYYWAGMILSARVSAIASNVFNFVLLFFFYSLFKGISGKSVEPLRDQTLDEIFEEANKK
jgi:hypothetical protein